MNIRRIFPRHPVTAADAGQLLFGLGCLLLAALIAVGLFSHSDPVTDRGSTPSESHTVEVIQIPAGVPCPGEDDTDLYDLTEVYPDGSFRCEHTGMKR